MSEDVISRSLEIIEKRIYDKLYANDMAMGVFTSKYHYQRMFREIVGDSVMEYVKKRKLTLAGLEIAQTNNSILDIALKFGYNSHENFTRAFKSYMGVTPTEYRKYKLYAISKATFKPNFKIIYEERFNMNKYEENINEIIRELNNFIAQAKETAEFSLKTGLPNYQTFWQLAFNYVNEFTDKLYDGITRVSSVSNNIDCISNRFAIIKLIEDVAFNANFLAFNVSLFVSRGTIDDIAKQNQICDKYTNLAQMSAIKSNRIVEIFNELATLIFTDMKKSVTDKIAHLVKSGEKAIESITDYGYIKDEISAIVSELSTLSYDEINVNTLEMYEFRMNIILLTASIDVVRSPNDKVMIENISSFVQELTYTNEFLNNLTPLQKLPESAISKNSKYFEDIAFQGNIMYFYLKGELSHEKLGKILTSEQIGQFDIILRKINDSITYAQNTQKSLANIKGEGNATAKYAFGELAISFSEIFNLMLTESQKLCDKGGAIKFLANEINNLAKKATACANILF